MVQPTGAERGHPEPEPIPSEPEPPQPIPPPEPVPAPEPPHAGGPPPWMTDPTTSIGYAEPPRVDFLDADPPTPPVEFPPVGAYPGEPGHPASGSPVEQAPPVDQLPAHARPTEQIPAFTRPSEQIPAQPWHPQQPWHAQHEKPGEWHTNPPEHLAWQHSPPPEFQIPPPPWEVQLNPEEPRRRRGGVWVSVALTITLLLCGGGAVSAYFLISNADTGKGAPDPATAVNRFLTAVYTQQDPSAADDLICRDARDTGKMATRITQIKGYAEQYDGATFRWNEPAVSGRTADRAVVNVQLTMATDDEKTAQQTLTITTVHKTGWLVCDVAG
jgi:hypothetical protein